jgi:hypothetical protein
MGRERSCTPMVGRSRQSRRAARGKAQPQPRAVPDSLSSSTARASQAPAVRPLNVLSASKADLRFRDYHKTIWYLLGIILE